MKASRADVILEFKKIKIAFLPFFSGEGTQFDLDNTKTLISNFITRFTRTDKHKTLIEYYDTAFNQLGPKTVYGIISSVYDIIINSK